MTCRFTSIQYNCRMFARAISNRISPVRNARYLHMGEYFIRGSTNEINLQTAVPLAGRKYLVSSDSPEFPKYLSGPKEDFPMLVKVKKGQEASMKQWAARCRNIIDQAYERFEKNGSVVALLFRGLPNRNEKDFSEWINNLGYMPFAYIGGISPRNEIQPGVAEGAHDENVVSIEPHNEMSYSQKFPKIFTISCFKKSEWGGETAICDNRDIHMNLDPNFVKKCEEKKIRYWNCLHSDGSDKIRYQSWQMRFKTTDKRIVDEFLEKENYSHSWDGNTLFYWKNVLPTTTHVLSGEKLWFNQLSPAHGSYYADSPLFEDLKLINKEYPCHTSYGDGEEFTKHEIDNHRRCLWENAVGFDWQNGDILFVDQLIVQHSRLSFQGERKVGVSLLDY